MISERKKILLLTLIKEYIKTAQAVSSGVLVSHYKLDVSPATVRNEMMELEEAGYIYQPHTSSGRIPTEIAYEFYLLELQTAKRKNNLKETELKLLEQLFKQDDNAYKKTARAISELANGAVFWAFHKNDLYYTGLTNLFSQPEFKHTELVCNLSNVIDRLEDKIDLIFEELVDGTQVMLGSKNPFGNFLSTVMVKYKKNNKSGLFGILGPLRMDYAHNLALVEFIKKKFE